jgi:hypothetical protein
MHLIDEIASFLVGQIWRDIILKVDRLLREELALPEESIAAQILMLSAVWLVRVINVSLGSKDFLDCWAFCFITLHFQGTIVFGEDLTKDLRLGLLLLVGLVGIKIILII